MHEIIFLWTLALIWIIFATMQDLKHREVANWLNFSLITFALGFRFFYSLFSETAVGFRFFYEGLIGLGIFFIIGNLLYYGHLFAGGDAKLMIALGAVLPFSTDFMINLKIFAVFFIIFLFAGAIYGLFWSIALVLKNFNDFKKEFVKKLVRYNWLLYSLMFLGLIVMIVAFLFIKLLFFTGVLIFILPYFYLYAKSVEEACMIKKVPANMLVPGDWLYKDLKVGKKKIKASWQGLDEDEIRLIQKNKKLRYVLIKQGIPFVPVFLISFVVMIWIWFSGFNVLDFI